jgi:hypothetical protein
MPIIVIIISDYDDYDTTIQIKPNLTKLYLKITTLNKSHPISDSQIGTANPSLPPRANGSKLSAAKPSARMPSA